MTATKVRGFFGANEENAHADSNHTFKTCDQHEALTSTSNYEKCDVKTSCGRQECHTLKAHLSLPFPGTFHSSNIIKFSLLNIHCVNLSSNHVTDKIKKNIKFVFLH